MTDTMTGTAGPDQATSTLDALIIGAGVAGLYAAAPAARSWA